MRELKINESPFVAIQEIDWELMADNTSSSEYMVLDDLYRLLNDGYDDKNEYCQEALEIFKKERSEVLKIYSERMTAAFGECLRNIADNIEKGDFAISYK